VDWVSDAVDDTVDTFNAVGAAVSDAVDETTGFFTTIIEAPYTVDIIESIQNVVWMTADEIQDAIEDFDEGTWLKIVDDVKYFLKNVPSAVQTYISIGCNFLSDLVDLDFVPFPLGEIKDDDFYTVVDCITDDIFDLAVDWAQDVATTFTNVVGGDADLSSFDFEPLLNTEQVEKQLNDTYLCLFELAQKIKEREENDDDLNLLEEATDFFDYDDMTIAVEISFTACTVSCGTASLGFAVSSSDYGLRRPFYSVAMGLDTSTVVGASIGSTLSFYKNFSSVVGTEHAISFGTGIDLPLLPDIVFPTTILKLDADDASEGDFVGFALESDILDFQFGLNGAFALGYNFAESKWVTSTSDLKALWNAVEDIVDDRIETIDAVVEAYEQLTDGSVLGDGGFLVKAAQNAVTSLVCPSGISAWNDDNTFMGNLSVLNLGAIEIYEVIFGNVEGDNQCNSSTAYDTLTELCQFGSSCSFTADTSTLDTLGELASDLACNFADSSDIDLTVVYDCPYQLDVFNLGCYSVNFMDVIEREWFEDYTNSILEDGWERRNNGIAKCAKIASDRGLPGFAIYNNGMCLVDDTLFDWGIFNERSNQTDDCPMDGLGSDITMNLYAFATGGIAYDDLGCINDTMIENYREETNTNLWSSMVSVEGENYLFADSASDRQQAISKCAQMAVEKSYKGFALHDGGECWMSNKFQHSTITAIREASGIDVNQTMSCGKGTESSMNVFMFPYLEFEEEEEQGLSAGEIAAIVLCPLFVIGLAVAGYFVWRRKKNGGDLNCNMDDWHCPDWRSMKCRCPCTFASGNEDGGSKKPKSPMSATHRQTSAVRLE